MPKRFRKTKPFTFRKKARRFAGTAAAATLGYIGGNFRGARLAGRAAWDSLGPSSGSSSRFVPTGRTHGRHREMRLARSGHKRRLGRGARSVGDAQMSYCRAWTSRRRFRLPKGFKKMLGPRYIRSVTFNRIETAGGTQTPVDVNLFTNGLATVPYALGFSDQEAMAVNLFADEVNTSIAPNTLKWKIESVTIESRIKNMTNVPIQIRLYDIVVRRDDEGPISLPTADWQAGLTEEVNPGVGATPSNTFPGAEPFESRKFCQRFKVLKKTTFHLGAGSEHVHKISGKPGWLNDRTITLQYTAMAKRTRFLMMVVEGGVTDNGVLPAAVAVNYSKHAVDVLTEYKVRFYAMEKARTIYSNFTNLVAVANEQTITEDTDVATPVVMA